MNSIEIANELVDFLNGSAITQTASTYIDHDSCEVYFSKTRDREMKFVFKFDDSPDGVRAMYETHYGENVRVKKNTIANEEKKYTYFNVSLRRILNDFERIQGDLSEL